MENNWAAENLQTIRTLMERSAIYRRALAPISTYVGIAGVVAAVIGWQLKIESGRGFIAFWMSVSALAVAGAFFLVRRQAVKEGEPLWSPPTRRVAQAMLPALSVGLAAGLLMAEFDPEPGFEFAIILIPVWSVLYGLALHAAGFFMLRGIKLFAWAFLIGGFAFLFAIPAMQSQGYAFSPHLFMGLLFGASHLAYGIYLYLTEKRKNEA